MSEVQRYNCALMHGIAGMVPRENGLWVQSADYDSELSALREEIERRESDWQTLNHEFDNVDKRLTATEQRNADQLALLHMSKELLSTISLHRTMAPNDWCDSFKNEVADRLEKLRAVLDNPTESGASE